MRDVLQPTEVDPDAVGPDHDEWEVLPPEFAPGDPDGKKTVDGIALRTDAEIKARELRVVKLAKEINKGLEADERAVEYTSAAIDLDDFLGEEEPPADWVIPGLLERQDRIIVTGLEGSGKSMLGRQVAMCAASGIHPFDLTFTGMKPVRVLVVDLENPEALVRKDFRMLRTTARNRYRKGNVIIVPRPDGMDLNGNDGAELRKEIEAAGDIDLLIIGPLYKMVTSGDISEEPTARELTATLDRLRIEYGFALWIEAHPPHSEEGKDGIPKVTRPYGASLFKRWPEFGYFLHYNPETGAGEMIRWRKDRQTDRRWPDSLRRGGEWPWTYPMSESDMAWSPVRKAAESFAAENKGRAPSLRSLAQDVGMTKTTLDRFLKAEAHRWDALKADLLERYSPPPTAHEGQGIITEGDEKVSHIDRE